MLPQPRRQNQHLWPSGWLPVPCALAERTCALQFESYHDHVAVTIRFKLANKKKYREMLIAYVITGLALATR